MTAAPAPALTEPQPRSFVERAAWAYAALQLEHDGRCPTPMFSLWTRGFDLGALGTHWRAVVAEGERLYRRHRALGIAAPPIPADLSTIALATVDRERLARLTERQAEILARLARGDHEEAVKTALGINRNTLRTHLRDMLVNLRSADLPAALAIYRRAAGGTGKIS
jgi:DNA-binding CsgD family transcriptional regulator